MNPIEEHEFKQCQPYSETDFPKAMKRLLEAPTLPTFARSYFPNLAYESFIQILKEISDIKAFQTRIISPLINEILRQSSKGLTLSGLENKSRTIKYLFLSNHRDILCDPAFFTHLLHANHFETPKICLGDNLLTHPLVIDLVKMNKGVTVKRQLPPRELLKWSYALSNYLRKQIKENIDSIWIAQRVGRAKDGIDQTQLGVLKMLALGSKTPFLNQIMELNLVPVSISYEYDPCDIFKARELYLRDIHGKYEKLPSEDITSMIHGITGFKGRIHIGIGPDLSKSINKISVEGSLRDQVDAVAKRIDQEIHANYKNWPTNYVAYDLLFEGDQMRSHYTKNEQDEFRLRMDKQLKQLNLSFQEEKNIRPYFLRIYANSVVRQEQVLDQSLLP